MASKHKNGIWSPFFCALLQIDLPSALLAM